MKHCRYKTYNYTTIASRPARCTHSQRTTNCTILATESSVKRNAIFTLAMPFLKRTERSTHTQKQKQNVPPMCVRVFGIGMAGVRCVTRHVFARSVPARSPCVTKNSVSWCAAATRCSQYHFSPQAAELPHPHRCCCWPKAKLIAAKLQLTHTAHNTAHCCLAWHADAAAAAADTGRRKKSGRPKTLWVAVDDGLAPLPEGNRGSYNAPSCDRPIGEGVLPGLVL